MTESGRTEPTVKDDVIALWRVLVCYEVVVWIVRYAARPIVGFDDPFARRAMAGAVSSAFGGPIGLGIGLIWYWLALRRLPHIPLALVGGVLFLSLASAVGAWRMASWAERRFDAEEIRREEVRTIQADAIERIVVYDEYMRRRLSTIEGRSSIEAFADECKDLERYKPNHPVYTDDWILTLETDRGEVDLECHFEEGHPDEVVIYIADAEPGWFRYYGSAISRSLRPWFEEHVVGTGKH